MTTAKLLDNIRNIHIDYLESDNEAKREEYYMQLRDRILQYLSLENLPVIFTISEFADLFEYNIENNEDFSIIGTCHAFEALEKYANNLLLFSWRSEYKIIKLYGGFFKHKVSRHLHGVEKLFKLMGYKQVDDYTLVFVEPLKADILVEISLNCLIASCECTFIQDFHQAAIGAGCGCGYKEVYKLRNNVKKLSSAYKHNKDKLSSSYFTNGNHDDYTNKREPLRLEDMYEKVRKTNQPSLLDEKTKTLPLSTRELLKPETHDRHIQASISAVTDLSSQQAETRAATWGYVDKTLGYQTDTSGKQKIQHDDDDDDDVALRRQQKANQLIDGYPHPQSDTNLYYPSYQPPFMFAGVMAHPMTMMTGFYHDPRSGIPSYPHINLSQPKMHIDENGHGEARLSQRSSVYDNVPVDPPKYWNNLSDPTPSPPSPFNKNDNEFLIDIDTSSRQKTSEKTKKQMKKKSKESRTEESSGSSSVLSIDENQWECPSCTMLNKSADTICSMCSRSKTKGPEAIPLKSGGKECSQCTYINEANVKNCSVCGTSLSHENSSTYV